MPLSVDRSERHVVRGSQPRWPCPPVHTGALASDRSLLGSWHWRRCSEAASLCAYCRPVMSGEVACSRSAKHSPQYTIQYVHDRFYPGQLSLAILSWVDAVSTSDSWGVNRHTARCTRPVSVVSQCKLVSGWELKKRRSAPPYGHYGSEKTYVRITSHNKSIIL